MRQKISKRVIPYLPKIPIALCAKHLMNSVALVCKIFLFARALCQKARSVCDLDRKGNSGRNYQNYKLDC